MGKLLKIWSSNPCSERSKIFIHFILKFLKNWLSLILIIFDVLITNQIKSMLKMFVFIGNWFVKQDIQKWLMENLKMNRKRTKQILTGAGI